MCTSVVTSFSFFHPGNKWSLRLMIIPWTNRISLWRIFISKCTISWEERKSQKVIKSRRWLNLHFQSRFKFIIIILIIGFRFFLLSSALRVNSHLWLKIVSSSSSPAVHNFSIDTCKWLIGLYCLTKRVGVWNGENSSYWGRKKQSVILFLRMQKICGWTVGFHLTAFDLIASILLLSASFSSTIPTFFLRPCHSSLSESFFRKWIFFRPFLTASFSSTISSNHDKGDIVE